MPLDHQAQAFLDLQAAFGFRGYHRIPLDEARALFLARDRHTPRQPVDRVEDRSIPPNGPGVRLYWPRTDIPPRPDGRRGGLVFLHGGGWIVGSPDSADVSCRVLANLAGVVVASVDYRLAPEHRFPAQVDDSLASWLWFLGAAAELGVDPARVALGGDSAGGNLALAVAITCRDRGSPLPALLPLVYPVTDHDFQSRSYREYAEGFGLTTEAMRYYWESYLPGGEAGTNPLASPLRADLRGLPPAWIAAAEFDPLRSEVEALADRFLALGTPVTYRLFTGQIHGFFHLGRVMAQGQLALEEAAAAVRKALGTA